MDIIQKINAYSYSFDELTQMNSILEVAMFMEHDVERIDEAFDVKALSNAAGSLLKKAGLHLHKGEGLMQQAMKGGAAVGKLIWYSIKAVQGDKEAKAKAKELANSEVKKEDVLAFLLNLDMATLHIFTGPIHFIDAVTGWHLWADVKEVAQDGLKKAQAAIENLIDVAKSSPSQIKAKLKKYLSGLIALFGFDANSKQVDAL